GPGRRLRGVPERADHATRPCEAAERNAAKQKQKQKQKRRGAESPPTVQAAGPSSADAEGAEAEEGSAEASACTAPGLRADRRAWRTPALSPALANLLYLPVS